MYDDSLSCVLAVDCQTEKHIYMGPSSATKGPGHSRNTNCNVRKINMRKIMPHALAYIVIQVCYLTLSELGITLLMAWLASPALLCAIQCRQVVPHGQQIRPLSFLLEHCQIFQRVKDRMYLTISTGTCTTILGLFLADHGHRV